MAGLPINASRLNSTIKEVNVDLEGATATNFLKKGATKDKFYEYTINLSEKCICFC
jgi:hypothetical protein